MAIQHSTRVSHPPSAPVDERQAENRRRLREFLRAIPRTEPAAQVELLGLVEGAPARLVTRAQLTNAIEHMRPRMRQVIHLTLEERRTREETRDYLHGISLRTLERDQNTGLDILIRLAFNDLS